jgi:LPS-assembly lipoprotein
MSLSKRGFLRLARGALALAPVLPLSACIQPMYGELSANAPIAADLRAVEVAPISDRLGHYLRNELIFAFNGTGEEFAPRYRLTVKPSEFAQTPILDTVTGRATAATVITGAEYTLVKVPGGQVVTKGKSTSIASYDRFSARYANVRAARDAEIRDAKTLAEDIHNRIALALTAQQP